MGVEAIVVAVGAGAGVIAAVGTGTGATGAGVTVGSSLGNEVEGCGAAVKEGT